MWLRADVPPTAEVMVVDNGWLDDIEVFFVADDRDVVRFHTANRYPFASRPIGAPPFAFPVPKASERVYVRSIGHRAQYPAIKAVFAKPIESELLLAKVRGVLSQPAR